MDASRRFALRCWWRSGVSRGEKIPPLFPLVGLQSTSSQTCRATVTKTLSENLMARAPRQFRTPSLENWVHSANAQYTILGFIFYILPCRQILLTRLNLPWVACLAARFWRRVGLSGATRPLSGGLNRRAQASPSAADIVTRPRAKSPCWLPTNKKRWSARFWILAGPDDLRFRGF